MNEAPPPAAGPERPGMRRGILVFFGVAVALSGLGFSVKIYEFAEDLLKDQGIGFAGAHLVTYMFVAGGFVLLLAGTFLRGHYADIEKPKHDMLEREMQHDRLERTAHRG